MTTKARQNDGGGIQNMSQEDLQKLGNYFRKILRCKFGLSGDILEELVQQCIVKALQENASGSNLRKIVENQIAVKKRRDRKFRLLVKPGDAGTTSYSAQIFVKKPTQAEVLAVREFINDSKMLSLDEKEVLQATMDEKTIKDICEERRAKGKSHAFRVVTRILDSAKGKMAGAFRALFGSVPSDEEGKEEESDSEQTESSGKKQKLIHFSESRHMYVDVDDPRFLDVPDGGTVPPRTWHKPKAKENEDGRNTQG